MLERNKQGKPHGHNGLMHWGMMACCAVMLLPIAAYFFSGGSILGAFNNIGAFAPLLLCVGAHLVLHRFMGKSCHNEETDVDETPELAKPETVKRQVAALR